MELNVRNGAGMIDVLAHGVFQRRHSPVRTAASAPECGRPDSVPYGSVGALTGAHSYPWLCSALLRAARDLAGIKEASAVMNRKDVNILASNPVDKTVVAEYDLSDVFHVDFRHYSSRARKDGEPIRSPEGAVCENGSDLRSVASDEETDGIWVIESLRGPAYFSHSDIRRRASS
jgi:hypothetical protein